MSKFLTLIISSFLSTLILNCQDWCKDIKSSVYNETKYYSSPDVVIYRVSHTENPRFNKSKKIQLHSDIFFHNEIIGLEFGNQVSTFNSYTNHRISYRIKNNYELNVELLELVIYTGDEVKEYGGQTPYSRISIGGKYCIKIHGNYYAILGQLALPRILTDEKTTYEMKIIYSRNLFNNLRLTTNIGGIYYDKENANFTYSIECKYLIWNKLEIIFENLSDYSHLTYLGNMENILLGGLGFYKNDKVYYYLTYEKNPKKSKLMNIGKVSVGLNHCF